MKNQEKSPTYLSYLLRLWQTSDQESRIWRASLESPGTGERLGFANLDDLIAFLEAQTGAQSDEESIQSKKRSVS